MRQAGPTASQHVAELRYVLPQTISTLLWPASPHIPCRARCILWNLCRPLPGLPSAAAGAQGSWLSRLQCCTGVCGTGVRWAALGRLQAAAGGGGGGPPGPLAAAVSGGHPGPCCARAGAAHFTRMSSKWAFQAKRLPLCHGGCWVASASTWLEKLAVWFVCCMAGKCAGYQRVRRLTPRMGAGARQGCRAGQ